jgi:hypothetical protein
MQFISNKIHVAPVSMEDAIAKAKEKAEPRSLDDILASIDESNKQVKTASTGSPKETKEAKACVCGKDDCPDCSECDCGEDGCEKCASSANAEVKTADLEILELSEEDEAKYFGEEEVVESDEAKAEEDVADHEKATPVASSTKTMKVAKKADFRGWNAEDIVKAWDNHGSVEKCVAASKDITDNPQVYCGLLQVASSEAMKVIKSAAKDCDCKPGKCAKDCDCGCKEKEESYGGSACASTEPRRFRKIAKLTGKDLGMLRQYFGKLYGEEYVSALLDQYAD